MTRQEEILNSSIEYNETHSNKNVVAGPAILSEEEYKYLNKNNSFIAGATWADEHSSKGLVDIEKGMLS